MPTQWEQFSQVIKEFDLTPKETIITYLVYSSGVQNSDVAKQADMSLNTLKTHLRQIYKKLSISSRPQLQVKIRGLLEEDISLRT